MRCNCVVLCSQTVKSSPPGGSEAVHTKVNTSAKFTILGALERKAAQSSSRGTATNERVTLADLGVPNI